jgi:hypothetical protein
MSQAYKISNNTQDDTPEKPRDRAFLYEAFGWSILSGGAIYPLQLFVDVPNYPTWAQNLLTLIACACLGTLIAVVRRDCVAVRLARNQMEGHLDKMTTTLGDCHSLCRTRIELLFHMTGLYNFFQSFKARMEADEQLAQLLLAKVSGHVWRIPQATPSLGYRILAEALATSNQWEGIHAGELSELGKQPLDQEMGSHFFTALRDASIPKKRIILVNSADFQSYKTPQKLDTERSKLIFDFWEITGRKVDCYFFDKEQLSIPMSRCSSEMTSIPPNRRDDIYDKPWPDCAMYNRRYMVAYRRGNHHAQPAASEGVLEVWTTDLAPRENATNEEQQVAYLAKAVRILFNWLEEALKSPSNTQATKMFIYINESFIKQLPSQKGMNHGSIRS